MARLGNTSLAGRPRRDTKACDIQKEKERITLATGESEVCVTRQAIDWVAPKYRLWHRCTNTLDERITQPRQSRSALPQLLGCLECSRGEGHSSWGIQSSRSCTLLAAAMEQRSYRRRTGNHQRSHPDRSPDFVGRNAQCRNARIMKVDRHVPAC